MSNGHRGPKGPFPPPPPGFCPNPDGSGVHAPVRLFGVDLQTEGYAGGCAVVFLGGGRPEYSAADLIADLRAELLERTIAHEREIAAYLQDLQCGSYIEDEPGLHFDSTGRLTMDGRKVHLRRQRRAWEDLGIDDEAMP